MFKTCLFICSGNYYRSRFAEIFFNQRAATESLEWRASSRGTIVNIVSTNVGPLSAAVIRALNLQGSELPAANRYPIQLQAQDIIEADLIIGLNEPEHRPYLETHFFEYSKKIEFWRVPDVDVLPAEPGLLRIKQEVSNLIFRFSTA